MQDQIMDLSKEIVERQCRETYISTMKDIIYCLMYDLHRTELENNYGIKPKDQERLKTAFKKNFNENFEKLWGASNEGK